MLEGTLSVAMFRSQLLRVLVGLSTFRSRTQHTPPHPGRVAVRDNEATFSAYLPLVLWLAWIFTLPLEV